jgi:hypothetical protein
MPFLGSLFSVDWGLLLRRQVSDPLRRDEATTIGHPPERSVVQVHAIFGVSLMAIQNLEVSSSACVGFKLLPWCFPLPFSGKAKNRAEAAPTGGDEKYTVDLKWV